MAEVMGEWGQGPRERGAEPRELRGRGSGQGWETGPLRGKQVTGRCSFRGEDNSQVRTGPPWVPEAPHHELPFRPNLSMQTRKWGEGGHCPETSSFWLQWGGGREGELWGPIVPTQRGSDRSVVCSFWCQRERPPPCPTPCRLGYQMRGLGSPTAAEDGLGLAPESQKRH